MLMLLLNYCTRQKQGGKRDGVRPIGSDGFKLVLTLLTKVVAVQVEIFIIEVGKSNFQYLLLKLYLD